MGWISLYSDVGGPIITPIVSRVTSGVAREANRVLPDIFLPMEQIVKIADYNYWSHEELADEMLNHGISLGQSFFGLGYNKRKYRDGKVVGTELDIPALTAAKNDWELAFSLGLYVPTINDAIVMRNRELISDGLFNEISRRNFGYNPAWAWVWNEMRNDIPGSSDLIRFAVRECFDVATVEKYGYNKELPIEILPYMKAQGLGGELSFDMPSGGTTTKGVEDRLKPQWFDLHWWSHWELPSITQATDMFFRLYDTSRYGPSPDVLNPEGTINHDIVFLAKDLEDLQKAQDYPQYWRRRLQAISYLPLTRTDVRRMRQIGVFTDKKGTYHAYRAIGYNDHNAELLANFTEELVRPKTFKKLKQTTDSLCQAFQENLLTPSELTRQLYELGYSERDVRFIVFNCDSLLNIKRRKKLVDLCKKGFFNGSINQSQANIILAKIPIARTLISQTLTEWNLEREVSKKFFATNKLYEMFEVGVLTDLQTQQRLENLNYDMTEVTRMMQLFQIKKLDHNKAKIIKTLAPFSEKNILKWFKSGYLDSGDVESILIAKNWDQRAIDAFMELNEIEHIVPDVGPIETFEQIHRRLNPP